MRICVITSMFPTKKAPHSGVFITRRIEALKKLQVDVVPYALVREETRLVNVFRKIVGKTAKEKFGDFICTDNLEIKYEVVHVRLGLVGVFLNSITHEDYYAWKAGRELSKHIKGRFDLVHAHWLFPTGKAAVLFGKTKEIPVMVTCHGSDVNVYMKEGLRKGCLSTLASATEVEFVSQKLMDTAKNLGGIWKKAHILPNGITMIPPSMSTRNGKIVGFVGNLIPIKRVDCFPEIFRKIYSVFPDVGFLIVGDGEQMGWLQEQMCDLPVTFVGRLSQEEVLVNMQKMSVLILPSRNEGWPCVVLEAYSCGTPVVGSNVGGIPEAIGDSNFIVDENENFNNDFSNRVIQVLKGAIDYDSDRLIKRAINYSWENLQQKEKEIYLSYEKSKE